MKKMVLSILPTILLLMILFGGFHQEVHAIVQPPAAPQIPAPQNKPPDLHFSILISTHGLGHAMVQLNDTNRLYTIGFAPSEGHTGLLSAYGYVRDDSAHSYDSSITFDDVSVDQYNQIRNWINSNRNLNYQVLAQGGDYNCMTYAVQVASAGGFFIPHYMYQNEYSIPFLGKLYVPDPTKFDDYFKSIGNGNRGVNGGTIKINTAWSPSADLFIGSYKLACSTCLKDPSYFASYYNFAPDAAFMGSYTTTVGHSASFANPISVNLSETIVAWDFGDGSNNYQTLSTSHTYSSQGNYAITFIAISENKVWSRTGTVMVSGNVGGFVMSVDKLGLLAPYMGLASTILAATVASAFYVKRVRRRKEKQ